MPNIAVPAAGEAMPATEGMQIITGRFSRRLMLMGAIASLPAVAASYGKTLAPDPLLDLIKQYQDGLAAFNALPEDDEIAAANTHLWKQPFDALSEWDGPAMTRLGALEALRLASYENGCGDSPLTIPLIDAALGYFEARL